MTLISHIRTVIQAQRLRQQSRQIREIRRRVNITEYHGELHLAVDGTPLIPITQLKDWQTSLTTARDTFQTFNK